MSIFAQNLPFPGPSPMSEMQQFLSCPLALPNDLPLYKGTIYSV